MAEFDAALKQRLIAFQEASGLSGTGIAGKETWERLVSAEPVAERAVEPVVDSTVDSVVDSVVAEPVPGDKTGSAEAKADPAEFPLLYKIVELERTDSAVTAFLKGEYGLDLDAVLSELDDIVGSTS